MKLHATTAMLGIMLPTSGDVRAQMRDVGPGSTVRGDILRGEGVFLQGAPSGLIRIPESLCALSGSQI